MNWPVRILLLWLFLGSICPCRAGIPDTLSGIIVDTVTVSGNKLTHLNIILREMEFNSGDTLDAKDLSGLLRESRDNIFNIRLFNFVTVDTAETGNHGHVRVAVSVVERWYIWPVPFLQISDRNFNAWWESRDFSRLTYGIDLTFSNVRGRNETLRLITHFGFNQQYGFTYKVPSLNKRQTLGLGFGASVELNREVAVTNENNKPVYYKNPDHLPQQLVGAFAELMFRPEYYTTHTLRVIFSHYYFSDSVMHIPGFSISDRNGQIFVSLFYMLKDDHRDVHYYPLHGYYLDFQVMHSIPYETSRNTWLKVCARRYWELSRRFYVAAGFTGLASLSSEHPFFMTRGMGYSRDFVRGYEVYVMDAQHYAIIKTNLKFALVPPGIFTIPGIRTPKFNTVPYAFYLNLFADGGYAFAPDDLYSTSEYLHNDLQNTLLGSTGLGLDFTTYYDIVIRLEGSFSLSGKPGFAVHFIAPI